MKAELRSLPRTLADLVAQHLVASGRFIDDDPELAYQHARTARRLASRLGGVREAVAITAYLAEHYDEALTEFRAVRRMSGNHEVIAMMADCERALGRPEKALALTKDKHVSELSEPTQMELLIVAAGARRDMGQTAAAIQTLDVPELTKRTRAEWLPRLRYAYADALQEAGRTDEALVWFHRAAGVDGDGVTGAAERAAELEGLEFTDLDDDDAVLDDEYFDDEDTTDESDDQDDTDDESADQEVDLDGSADEADDADDDSVDEVDEDSVDDAVDQADEEAVDDDSVDEAGDGVDEVEDVDGLELAEGAADSSGDVDVKGGAGDGVVGGELSKGVEE
ncbi:hypothetical protein [Kribbella kalugense]|uniref:Tetratricopeptide repeat protein n=1 Tax=Kribbella kalugense TaxID=2512221 RepID=A0A4R7ZA46_9ACTN|nr:hypothetical protein [Kribbella kalugense]TDW13962.1 hypothetical protein EV650_7541 [Kribbella kalugense]